MKGGDFLSTLYIREFPEELWKALKVKAAQEGKTLKQVCIEILREAVEKEVKGYG